MQSWYLLYCKRGQLQRAQEHLERQAVNCLAPMITLEKIVRGKRTAVSEPLFPNYLFVEFDPEVIHTTTINATRGVSHFVRFGASPAIVPSAVIHQLSVYKPKDIVDPSTPYPGDKVIITEGAISVISRCGSTGSVIRFSSPCCSSSVKKSRKSLYFMASIVAS
ncbi:transcriptional activator [Escherichia coli]|nr:transcriptional activator [Escherichia coli]